MTVIEAAIAAPAARGRPTIGTQPYAVIMQPHTLCPLDCDYCYLPDRRKTLRMPLAVAEAVAADCNVWALDPRDRAPDISVVWHISEPLALGVAHLEGLMAPFDAGVQQAVQTSGVHISDDWCEFFGRHQVKVGVSLDGPADMNAARRMLGGQPAYDRTVRGIGLLNKHGIRFGAIAVARDPEPADARRLCAFFADLGAQSLAVNIEETEGVNRAGTRDPGRVRAFWRAMFDAAPDFPGLELREVSHVTSYLAAVADGRAWPPPEHVAYRDPFPTVAHDGRVTLLSPELSGFSDPAYGSFSSGSVLDEPLRDIIARAAGVPWISDFLDGIGNCAASCALFDFCGGSEASNRHFEGVGFSGTVTQYCTNTIMALMGGGRGQPERNNGMSDTDRYTTADAAAILAAIGDTPLSELTTFVVERDGGHGRGEYSTCDGRSRFRDWSKGGWDYMGQRPGILA